MDRERIPCSLLQGQVPKVGALSKRSIEILFHFSHCADAFYDEKEAWWNIW
jgi:hypothetical protein